MRHKFTKSSTYTLLITFLLYSKRTMYGMGKVCMMTFVVRDLPKIGAACLVGIADSTLRQRVLAWMGRFTAFSDWCPAAHIPCQMRYEKVHYKHSCCDKFVIVLWNKMPNFHIKHTRMIHSDIHKTCLKNNSIQNKLCPTSKIISTCLERKKSRLLNQICQLCLSTIMTSEFFVVLHFGKLTMHVSH